MSYTIVPIKELKELREKAEKWNRHLQEFGKEHDYIQANIDTIMSGLVVEVPCPDKEHKIPICYQCGGTGYTSRPAVAGEVRELVEMAMTNLHTITLWVDEKGSYFKLSNGGKMRLEE